MFTYLPSVKNCEILAFAKTEDQSTGPCGIILAQRHDGELITAWYRLGDSEWCHGHYFHPHLMKTDVDRREEERAAYGDFLERVRSWKGPRRKEIPEAAIELAKTVNELTDPENEHPDMDTTPEDARALALAILGFVD